MKKLAWIIVLTSLTATPALADCPNCFGPINIDAGLNYRFNVKCGYANYNLAPWYAYFPYDAQFGHVGPTPGASPWGVQAPLRGAGPVILPGVQTFGPYGLPPSYWYKGR